MDSVGWALLIQSQEQVLLVLHVEVAVVINWVAQDHLERVDQALVAMEVAMD